jgi:membrane protein implicated in regulation of membrane protease activity
METIFLVCFAFGALFTLVSVVLGVAGHGAGHLGHGHEIGHGNTVGHEIGHGNAVGHEIGHATAQGHGDLSEHLGSLPLFSVSSIVGALTWFGAAGYLLLRLGDWALPAVVLGALLAGGVGWYLIARFLGLVLAGEREMDPADYRLEGTVGQLIVGIPAGGTGEVVFSKAGSRRSEAARAASGESIPRGSEVVITTYADGFATVQPWGEFIAAREKLALPKNREA